MIDNSQDIIDSRKVVERIEELENRHKDRWIAGRNMPGYLPDTEPVGFDSFESAKSYLAGELRFEANDEEDDEKAKGLLADAEEVMKLEEGEFGQTIGEYHYWIVEGPDFHEDQDEAEELEKLKALIEEVKNHTGPEFEYGVALIAEGYFEQYAQEMAVDIGAIESLDSWPANCLDWEKAADVLKHDYSSVDFDGSVYWVRG